MLVGLKNNFILYRYFQYVGTTSTTKKLLNFGQTLSISRFLITWIFCNFFFFVSATGTHTSTHDNAHTDALAQTQMMGLSGTATWTHRRGLRLAIESNDTEILNYFFAVTMNATTTSGWQRRPPTSAATSTATAMPAEGHRFGIELVHSIQQ